MNSPSVFAVTIVVLAHASGIMASPLSAARMNYRTTIGSHVAALMSSLSRFYPASHRVDLGVA